MVDFHAILKEHQTMIAAMDAVLPDLEVIARRMLQSVQQGGKILWMGNGGSAADAQHLAAELVGRFTRERGAIASIALTTDTSILTALANDYDFETIFSRQIEALCCPGDVVIGISTSGNSENVLRAMALAQRKKACTVGLMGQSRGRLGEIADFSLAIPSKITARIQEGHILVGHMLCDWIESDLLKGCSSES